MPVVGRSAATAMLSRNRKTDHRGHRRVRKRKGVVEEEDENIGCRGWMWHDKLSKWLAYLRDRRWFQTFIIIVIFLAGILVGIQTYPLDDDTVIQVVDILDVMVLAIFVVEILVKIGAEGRYPHRFFYDAWNVFDFIIVAVGLMPFGGQAVTVLRLVRLLRVLKLVRALPKLRILVMGLLKSLSSIAYIGLLLGLLFYLYAVLGVSLFGPNDPVQMGTLHICFLTLFRCSTLEDWTDVMYTAMEGCDEYGYDGMEDKCTEPQAQGILAALYFCSFIVLSSMMILNLFIGVITSSMQDAKTDLSEEADALAQDAQDGEEVVERRLNELSVLMAKITDEVEVFAQLEKERKAASIINLSGRDVLANAENRTTAESALKTLKSTKLIAVPDSPAKEAEGDHPTVAVPVSPSDKTTPR